MTDTGTELELVPPSPVTAVTQVQAAVVVPVDPEQASQLEAAADTFADSVAALDVHSPEFAGKVGSITRMGDREMRDAAAVSNRMLERPVKAMGSGLFDASSPVSKSLIDLRNTVEELDPSRQGDLFSPRKLLGMIPMGSKVRDYFDRYRSSQTHLNAIINSLYRGQDELRKDNAAIEQEKVNLWATMGRLQQYALMAARLDLRLEDRIAALEATDPERARMLRQDVQFYVRQKHQDLLTQLAVAVQGYLALDLVRRNNHELIKGVDRATTTTVAALRTAVMVAQALANQRLVLDQITALNSTTGNLIESTSSMLRQQTGRIHDQAASATINLNQLKTAFANIYATMEAVDTYKGAALQSMRSTVEALESEVVKARGYLERAKGSPALDDGGLGLGTGELALPAAGGGS
ncbi:MAG: toxic anion resistance protein [Actinomycetota bacterium]|nr:toxic anion resistance protein [Actinomycetota bacterium]